MSIYYYLNRLNYIIHIFAMLFVHVKIYATQL